MVAPEVVLIDANVLFSRTLRDWVALLHSSPAGDVFEGRWTEDIMAETIRSLRRKYPILSGGQLAQVRDGIEAAFEGGRVTQYEIDPDFPGSDEFDAHLHSAAIACRATIVLTRNGCDLLPPSLDPDELPYEIYAPDEFFMLVDQSAPEVVREVTARQLMYFMRKHEEVDLPDRLRKAQAPRFAARVAEHLQTIPIHRYL